MLFSLPVYLGLDSFSGPFFKAFFGYLSLALVLPALVYSASDYWRSARSPFGSACSRWMCRSPSGWRRFMARAFTKSSPDGRRLLRFAGGLDFLPALRDDCFSKKLTNGWPLIVITNVFPFSVVRLTEVAKRPFAISQLSRWRSLALAARRIIPADARLVQGAACWITVSSPARRSRWRKRRATTCMRAAGSWSAIEVETVKPVSQSYLTSLWNHEAFEKNATTSEHADQSLQPPVHAPGWLSHWARRCSGVFAGNPARGD